MNATNPTNPFLTTEVYEACNEARTLYLDTLARRQSGSDSVDWLERLAQQSHQRLDTAWGTALSLAFADQVRGVSIQFVVVVKEWGLYRALTDLIDADEHGLFLDPAHPDTYGDIQRLLEHQVVNLATELLNEWQKGWQQRQAERLGQQQDWQAVAFDQVQQTMQHQVAWHDVAFQMLQEQRTGWQTGHQVAQQWSNVALDGVKQAQEGAREMYAFVASTQANVVGMHEAFQHHLEQNLPDALREAAREETRERRRSRFRLVLILGGTFLLLYVLAYFLVTHLY